MIDERVVVDTYSTDIVDPPHCHIHVWSVCAGMAGVCFVVFAYIVARALLLDRM